MNAKIWLGIGFLISIVVLSGCGKRAADEKAELTLEEAARAALDCWYEVGSREVPTGKRFDTLANHWTPNLARAWQDAADVEAAYEKRYGAMMATEQSKPPYLMENDFMSNFYEGPTYFRLRDPNEAGLRGSIIAEFIYDPDRDGKAEYQTEGTLQLLKTPRGWKLENVIWEGDFSLLELLDRHVAELRLTDGEAKLRP